LPAVPLRVLCRLLLPTTLPLSQLPPEAVPQQDQQVEDADRAVAVEVVAALAAVNAVAPRRQQVEEVEDPNGAVAVYVSGA
jgi:hypothetical protein